MRRLAVLLLFLAPAAFAGNDRALLIGISQYSDPDINDLAYADEDMKSFAAILKNFADYRESDITLLLNDQATKQRIVGALVGIVKDSQKKPLDHFILMYAGHGLPSNIMSQKTNSFLAPHDAVPSQFFPEAAGMVANETFVNKAWLINQLSSVNAKNIVILLDSCYSGAKDFGELYADNLGFKTDFLGEGSQRRGIVVVRKKGADAPSERRIAFLASSREDQPSAEYKELQHGALSYTLFEYLNTIRKNTEETEHADVTVENMYSGISRLFDEVKVNGDPLSKVHQPVLFPIPDYDGVKDMPFVTVRGIKPPAPKVASQAPASYTGTVLVDTGGQECEATIDGLGSGRKANPTFELMQGQHLVSLYFPGTNFNRTLVVDVKAGASQTIQVAMKGSLAVESKSAQWGRSAPDLDVYVDGRYSGRTPLRLPDLTAGTHTLKVITGGVTRQRQVEIRPDSPLLVRYKIVLQPVKVKRRDDSGAGDVTF